MKRSPQSSKRPRHLPPTLVPAVSPHLCLPQRQEGEGDTGAHVGEKQSWRWQPYSEQAKREADAAGGSGLVNRWWRGAGTPHLSLGARHRPGRPICPVKGWCITVFQGNCRLGCVGGLDRSPESGCLVAR